MKKLLTMMLCSTASVSYAQIIDVARVPKPVTKQFVTLFPAVKNVKWEKEKGQYEANFTKEGRKMSVLFEPSGVCKEIEKEIPSGNLPSSILTYIRNYKHDKNLKISEAAELKLPETGNTNFVAQVGETNFIFDASGKFLRSEKD